MPEKNPLHFGLTPKQLEASDRTAALWIELEDAADYLERTRGEAPILIGVVSVPKNSRKTRP